MKAVKNIDFQYDTLIDRRNICDRLHEIKAINRMVARNQRIVLYGPRRYGKTSLITNVIGPDFVKSNRKGLVISIDFMDVQDLSSIEQRLRLSLSNTIQSQMKMRGWVESFISYFKNLSLTIDMDPITGQPSFSVKGNPKHILQSIDEYFLAIQKLQGDRPVLLTLDEFQDVHYVKEAEAILRKNLQTLSQMPVIISGSKRLLLTDMFARSKSPFFGFGDEVDLPPIQVHDWLPYFNMRLRDSGKSIDENSMRLISEKLHNVPNAISEVGFWIKHDEQLKGQLTITSIWNSVERHLLAKEQVFRYQLTSFSLQEKAILNAIAENGYVKQPTSKDFLRRVFSNASSVKKTFSKFLKLGVTEWEIDRGYRLSDPLLGLFLARQAS